MLLKVLYRREGALAWDFRELGRVSKDVIPPVIIDTVPYQAWRADQFPVPKKLQQVVIDIIQEMSRKLSAELRTIRRGR
jgi:hypothetical protein